MTLHALRTFCFMLSFFLISSAAVVSGQEISPDLVQKEYGPNPDRCVSLALFKGVNPFRRTVTSIQPTPEMLAKVEDVLQAYHRRCERKDDVLRDSLRLLTKDAPSSVFAAVDLDRAYRQYACGIDNRGDTLVYLNGFCQIEHVPRWRTEWVIVSDGGPCFFRAVVNLTSGRIEMLRVNGFA